MEKVFPRLWEANEIYRPDYRLSAPLVYIRRPLPAKEAYGDDLNVVEGGWNELSVGTVNVRIISAGHLDLFMGETTKALAKIVGEALGSVVVRTQEGQDTAHRERVA
jgi:hypothetical protein